MKAFQSWGFTPPPLAGLRRDVQFELPVPRPGVVGTAGSHHLWGTTSTTHVAVRSRFGASGSILTVISATVYCRPSLVP